jgi:hypothetical protein
MKISSLRASCRFALALTLGLFASCSSTGKFKNVGEPPMWKDTSELPAPDDGTVEPNTLRIVLQCPTIDEDDEFKQRLTESVIGQCRNAGMGDVRLLPRGSGKKAHYEIVVYEAGENGQFSFNEEAGVLAGLGAGVTAGLLTESLGIGVVSGGVIGTVAAWALAEKKEVYSFAGVCRQRTSAEGEKKAETSNGRSSNGGGGSVDGDMGAVAEIATGRAMFEKSTWNLKTRSFEFPFMFSIVVSGGSMTSKADRDAEARNVFEKKFPRFATGGTSIGG